MQDIRPIYEVTFQDGSSAHTDGEHLWSVLRRYKTHSYTEELLTTKQIAETIDIPTYPVQRVPVHFKERELLVDPYLIGVLLGDGGLTVGITITSEDEEIIKFCKKQAYLWDCYLVKRDDLTYQFSTKIFSRKGSGEGCGGAPPLRMRLPYQRFLFQTGDAAIDLIYIIFNFPFSPALHFKYIH